MGDKTNFDPPHPTEEDALEALAGWHDPPRPPDFDPEQPVSVEEQTLRLLAALSENEAKTLVLAEANRQFHEYRAHPDSFPSPAEHAFHAEFDLTVNMFGEDRRIWVTIEEGVR